jgi:hypothetical protein
MTIKVKCFTLIVCGGVDDGSGDCYTLHEIRHSALETPRAIWEIVI